MRHSAVGPPNDDHRLGAGPQTRGIGVLVDVGMRVKDACAKVVAVHQATGRGEGFYDAVLRFTDP